MAQVVVRNLDNELKDALKRRAQRHGCSMEEEIRRILLRAVNEETPQTGGNLGSRIAQRFAGIGLEAPLPELHGQAFEPIRFDR